MTVSRVFFTPKLHDEFDPISSQPSMVITHFVSPHPLSLPRHTANAMHPSPSSSTKDMPPGPTPSGTRFVLGTTLRARDCLSSENYLFFLDQIGSLRCCQLMAFMHLIVPKKHFVCLVKNGTFARAWKRSFLSNCDTSSAPISSSNILPLPLTLRVCNDSLTCLHMAECMCWDILRHVS